MDERRDDRRLLAAAALAGLGLGVHLSLATLGLGYIWLFHHSAGRRSEGGARAVQQRRMLGLATLATLAGSSIYLYLPIRAAMEPALDLGGQRLGWMITGGNFKYLFSGELFSAARLGRLASSMATQAGWPVGLLSVLGLGLAIRFQRDVGLALLLAIVGNLGFFFLYDVHDVEVFLLPSLALLCCAAGIGLDGLDRPLPGGQFVSSAVAAVLIIHLAMRAFDAHPQQDLSQHREAQIYGGLMVERLPAKAIMVDFSTPAEWKYKAVFGHYFQRALGQRPDVGAVTKPGVADLARLIQTGRPVFLYTEVESVARHFRVTPWGSVYLVQLERAQ